jgi:uncharacterized Zn-finger protein
MNKQKIAKFLIVHTVVLITAISTHQPSLTKSNTFNGYFNLEVKQTPVSATINSLDFTHPQVFLEINRENYNLNIQKLPEILLINLKNLEEALKEIGNILRYLPQVARICVGNQLCNNWLPTLGIGGVILGVGYIIVVLIDNNNAS